jgi:hypothetical protein
LLPAAAAQFANRNEMGSINVLRRGFCSLLSGDERVELPKLVANDPAKEFWAGLAREAR